MRLLQLIVAAIALTGCSYPSNVVNDVAHMGDPTYDDCRRNADPLSNYGARCANEADPKVKAAKAEQARQAAEQQRQVAQAAEQRQVAQQNEDSARGYSPISVRDFVLDGKELAARSAKLSLIGAYLPVGNLEMLFGTDLDAIQFANGQDQNSPTVHLLTENASRDFRSQLLACRSNPATAYVGCPVRILGQATICELSNSFGARRSLPCIAIDGGSVRAR
jgi:hypothetical protein